MKMKQTDFDALKRDFYLVVEAAKAIQPAAYGALTMRDAWDVYFRICGERSYGGELRAQLEQLTSVPCTVAYTGEIYGALRQYLNGPHIETALRKIMAA